MATRKKLRKAGQRVRRKVGKGRLLGALLIMAFVAFGSIVVNYYIFKYRVNTVHAVVVLIFIGGSFIVLSEMRGGMGRNISRVRKIKIRRKAKRILKRRKG